MRPIPPPISAEYDSLLQKGVSEKEHSYYRKWLRYYLDYCQKYNLDKLDKGSLSPFINKLKEKKQSDSQQKQAVKAITIYYELESANNEKANILKNRYGKISRKKDKPKLVSADWRSVYNRKTYIEITYRTTQGVSIRETLIFA